MSSESLFLARKVQQALIEARAFDDHPLNEANLGQRFGVSRAPIREALTVLEYQGGIRRRQRKGIYLTRPTTSSTADIFDLRAVLEEFAGRLAAERAAPKDIRRLKKLATKLAGAQRRHDEKLCDRLDIEFHETVLALARHAALRPCLAGLNMLAQTVRYLGRRGIRDPFRPNPYSHAKIAAAIAARNGKAAGRLLRKHVEHAKRIAVEHVLRARIAGFPNPNETKRPDQARALSRRRLASSNRTGL